MAYDKDFIGLVVKEVLMQTAQQGTQQESQQIAEAVQQAIQKVQGSQQEKSSTTETKQEEINTGEAHRAAVFTDKEMWGVNKKLVSATELKEKELAIAEREAKLRKQASLDAIEVSEREHAALVTKLADLLTIDFRTAAYHPISPNDRDNKGGGKKQD